MTNDIDVGLARYERRFTKYVLTSRSGRGGKYLLPPLLHLHAERLGVHVELGLREKLLFF